MALINCPECAREISDKTPHCVHCGYQRQSATIEATGKPWNPTFLLRRNVSCRYYSQVYFPVL
jgi:hypothetical protein